MTAPTAAQSAAAALAKADPVKYKALVERQKKYAFRPHSDGQRAIVEDETRFIVVRAGRRYGKTKVAARKLVSKAMRNPGKVVWWCANTYKNTQRGYREVVRQIPPEMLAKPAPPATANNLIITLKNGTRIEFYSGMNPDAMAGEGVFYVVIDEAALQNEIVWTQAIRPTLMDHGGGALLISTPRGRNWFYNLARRGEDPAYKDYASYHFTSWDNPLIGDGEIAEFKQSMPAIMYEQEVMAEFIAGSAGVMVVPESGVVPMRAVVPGETLVMGLDLAKHEDFTVIDVVGASDRRPVFHERFNSVRWPAQRDRVHQVVRELGAPVTIGVDATGVGDVIFDDLEDAGLDVVPIKFSMQWKNMAVKLLSADLEQGYAFILQEQLREFEDYEYTITAAGNITYSAPEGQHDDEVSAKLIQHWVLVNDTLEFGVRTADVGGGHVGVDGEVEPTAHEGLFETVPAAARSREDLINDPAVWS